MKIKLTEQQFRRVILKEQRVSFPVIVKDTFDSGGNCDRLHAFQSSSGKVVGNMNVTVGDKLKEIYNLGYNPEVTQVDVIVNGDRVSWTVTIKESKDGKAWIGFTSRGAGCNGNILIRATSAEKGNDVGTLRKNIISVGLNKNNNFDLEMVNEYIYDGVPVADSFKQVFYRYTRPTDYPPHSSSSQPITIPQTPTPKIEKKSIANKGSLSNFLSALRKKTIDKTIDLDNIAFTFTDINNQKLEYREDPNGTKVERLAFAISLRGKPCESCESIMDDFPRSKVLFEGEFSCKPNPQKYECRSWELIAIIP